MSTISLHTISCVQDDLRCRKKLSFLWDIKKGYLKYELDQNKKSSENTSFFEMSLIQTKF